MAGEICKECDTVDPASHIVHSGTDGFYLGLAEGQLHNICYDCGKKRYIESLMVVSLVEGMADFEA